jgi:hypothetical protein
VKTVTGKLFPSRRGVGVASLLLWFALVIPAAFLVVRWTKTSRAIQEQNARYEEGMRRLAQIQELDGGPLLTTSVPPNPSGGTSPQSEEIVVSTNAR